MEYHTLAQLFEQLESTSLRLEKTKLVAEFLKKTPKKDITAVVRMLQGKIYADHESEHTGISTKLVAKALAKMGSVPITNIEQLFKKYGDLGTVAKHLFETKKQTCLIAHQLTVNEVFNTIQQLAALEGKGSTDKKLDLLSSLLVSANPLEACYVARTLIETLRIGLGAGTLRDALVWAFVYDINYNAEKNDLTLSAEERALYNDQIQRVQHALDITNDYALVAHALLENTLDTLTLHVGRPIKMMLYQKAIAIKDAFEKVGSPAAFEYKYDGFRVQIHKQGTDVKIYTRRLDDVSQQFPEIIQAVKKQVKSTTCILDAEAVCFDPKSKKYLPFQKVSQRIKRKHNIAQLQAQYPVEVHVFDLLFDGKSYLDHTFKERRFQLQQIIDEEPYKIVLATQIITSDEKTAQSFYEESLQKGEEGIMAKSLEAPYKPGSRVGYGVKIKQIMDPLDVVIVGAEYGEGKRSGWLSSFEIACASDHEFLGLGKVSTGFKEKDDEGVSFEHMSTLLQPFIVNSEGKHVQIEPKIVIEVGYEEIQKSTTYSSGYALRFPRFLRLRTDEKSVHDANTIDDVKELFRLQRGRSV